MRVQIFNLGDGADDTGLVANVVGENGENAKVPIGKLGKLTLNVKPGAGVVLECVDTKPQDENAVILGSEVAIRDGGC